MIVDYTVISDFNNEDARKRQKRSEWHKARKRSFKRDKGGHEMRNTRAVCKLQGARSTAATEWATGDPELNSRELHSRISGLTTSA